ncbi:MAG TPA: hypothetical protein PKI03_28370 [Pseudomonadota bacterium]|nr:hypothetical protein [Pseudomonadota bacterium]
MSALGLLCPTPATAHQQYAPSLVNRYGKLALADQHGLRLVHTLMVGGTPAGALRREHDRSRDGRLDPDEQRTLCTVLGQRMREGLSLSLDTQPLQPRWEPPQCAFSGTAEQPLDSLGELPFSVEISASLALPHDTREHLLRYEDRIAAPPIGEVELRIEEGPGATLLASWQGAEPTERAPTSSPVQRQFQSLGPPRSAMSDRSISLRYQLKPAPQTASNRPRFLYALTALLLAAGLAALARRVVRHAG